MRHRGAAFQGASHHCSAIVRRRSAEQPSIAPGPDDTPHGGGVGVIARAPVDSPIRGRPLKTAGVSFPHPPRAARASLDRLAGMDPDLAAIERRAGPLPWRTRPVGFPGLLQAIVGQQISNQAAAAIWRRVRALPGALEPAGLLALSDEALRGAGLSRPKVAHARSLAAAFLDGTLDQRRLARLDDEGAVAAIAAVRGLGRWTAEVYLLFALGRPDVFPAGDLALAAAAADLKGLAARPKPPELRALAEAWRPARGLAARLLWHHWRHITGRPAFDDIPA
jgi:DNA-3-methyladenine glycosylase II